MRVFVGLLLLMSACTVEAPERLQPAPTATPSPGATGADPTPEPEPAVVPEPEPEPEPQPQPQACPAVANPCAFEVLDSFEADPVTYEPAAWATATAGSVLSRSSSGATDGASALAIPLKMSGSGYAQGYVGRPIQRSLKGCARVSLDLTLPANAPQGLRAKAILHLDGNWTEPDATITLTPGATTTLHLPLAASFASLPAREHYEKLTTLGVKIDASNVAYNGPVYLDRVHVAPDWPSAQHAKSVGTFGGYIRSNATEIPTSNGFLTFNADNQAGKHALTWPKLGPNDGAFTLVESRFGNGAGGGTLSFVDWTTLQADAAVNDGGTRSVRALMSRVFPAVRYMSTATHLTLATKKDGRARMRGLAIVQSGVVQTIDLNTSTVATAAMSEPWIVLFAGGAAGWPFDAPLLVTFEKKPLSIVATTEGINVTFATSMGAVHVMPLQGLQRSPSNTAWLAGLPSTAIDLARAWVPKLAAFPVSVLETATNDTSEVHITASVTHQSIQDAWGTQPEPLAVVPPLVAQAQDRGYPVRIDGLPADLATPTYFGPFRYVAGNTLTYHLPLPNGVSRLELPVRVTNDPHATTVRAEMLRVIREQVPNAPADFYLDGDDRAAQFLCEAYATLEPGDEREKAKKLAAQFIEHGWLDTSLQTLTEPVTAQTYLNAAKYWASNEPFDKEWYTGRQLAALAACAELVDLDIARGVWPKARSLYRYDQVFFDWATGSALSSVFGYTALIDGVYFAWDGMLGTARLAKHFGDTAIYDDAIYHAARQQLAVFMLWHHAEWAKSIDYGVGHIGHVKDAIETRGAIDGFVEDTGCTTLEFQSFWQTSNAIAFDVLPQFALYRDFGIKDRLRALLFDIMPPLHPSWQDGNVFHTTDNVYYGGINTGFHLTARAQMFHADPAPLYQAYLASEGTQASQQWYSMRWHGVSGPMLLAIERAKAKTIEVPVARVRPESIVFDAAAQKLSFTGTAIAPGSAVFRVDGVSDTIVDVCPGDAVTF